MASCSSLELDIPLAKHCLPCRSALRKIESTFLDASLTIGIQAALRTLIHTTLWKKRLANIQNEIIQEGPLQETQKRWPSGESFRSTAVRGRLLRGLRATALQPV